jgi:hypothetical protein
MTLALENGNNFVMVLNGEKGWTKRDGKVQELHADRLKISREDLYVDGVVSLTPLLQKSFSLSMLGDDKIGERVVTGVRVAHAGHGNVDLYFDRNAGLLGKTVFGTKRPGVNKEIVETILYDNYQDFGGVKRQTQLRVLLDGELYIESHYYDYRLSESVDNTFFERP